MDDPSTSGVTEGFGLMFYNARMYDPALGRFTSADSIIPPGVQGYDRYAYVSNNPIKYTDPTGHEQACEDLDYCGGGGGGGGNPSPNVPNNPPDDEEDDDAIASRIDLDHIRNTQCPVGIDECEILEYGKPTLDDILYIRGLIADLEYLIGTSAIVIGYLGQPAVALWLGIEAASLVHMDAVIFSSVEVALRDDSTAMVEMTVFTSKETSGKESVSYVVTSSDGTVTEHGYYVPHTAIQKTIISMLKGRETNLPYIFIH